MASTAKTLPSPTLASRDANSVTVPQTCTFAFTFQNASAASDTGLMQWVAGLSGVLVYVTGIVGDTITPQTNNDGTQNNLVAIPVLNLNTQAVSTTITTNGVYLCPTPGYSYLQFNLTRVGGTVTVVGNGFVATNDLTIAEMNAAVSENISQWGGNVVAAGNGVTGTGSPRVTIASDNTPFPIKIDQTTPASTNGVTPVPSANAAAQLTTAGAAAQASNRVIKASAGTLFLAFGYNNNAGTRYIHVFNAAALPADGAVPFLPPIPVATGQNWSLNLGQYGYAFTTGIVIANSSTAATLTVGAADQWISATYL